MDWAGPAFFPSVLIQRLGSSREIFLFMEFSTMSFSNYLRSGSWILTSLVSTCFLISVVIFLLAHWLFRNMLTTTDLNFLYFSGTFILLLYFILLLLETLLCMISIPLTVLRLSLQPQINLLWRMFGVHLKYVLFFAADLRSTLLQMKYKSQLHEGSGERSKADSKWVNLQKKKNNTLFLSGFLLNRPIPSLSGSQNLNRNPVLLT